MPREAAPGAPIHGRGGRAASRRPFRLERPHARRDTCARTRASALRGGDAQLVQPETAPRAPIPAHPSSAFGGFVAQMVGWNGAEWAAGTYTPRTHPGCYDSTT